MVKARAAEGDYLLETAKKMVKFVVCARSITAKSQSQHTGKVRKHVL